MSEISFAFTDKSRQAADAAIEHYPEGRARSAVMPLLDIAQRQNGGWLSTGAIEHVAAYLDMPVIRVHEMVTFYSMYNMKPVGRNFVQLCRTTPCWLTGSDGLLKAYRDFTGCGIGETSEDGLFSMIEVECLGACCNAPMVQINDDYYEDLTPKTFTEILQALKDGETPEPGPQSKRTGSEPAGGLTSLTGGQNGKGL
ncbi:MAG: NADH-quinone oxidoreductase subunit NuoE [Alphaproteobacteria bacterium]|nr:NADH-quinone oxidoreductase subunit NuoE [Alphaproteobacteria bacterium]